MLLLSLLLSSFTFANAPTDQQTAAAELADSFLLSHRPVNIGCDTDTVAMQVPELKERWSPLCSHGTLTAVSNMLYFGAYMFNTDNSISEYTFKQTSRTFLSDPSHVKSSYRDLKPFVLQSVRMTDVKKVDEVRGYITTTLVPDFSHDVSPELRALYAAEAAADRAMWTAHTDGETKVTCCDPRFTQAYTATNLAFGTAALAAGFHDPMAVQWRLRREKEGGQALVDAYRWVFTDFAKSI